jgi:hypothetical protein
MRMRRHRLVGVLLAVAGCSGLGEAVKVQRTAGATAAEPRPKGCEVELLYHPPTRPYRELAVLTSQVSTPPPGGAPEVLKDPACGLGADAVIVTRRFPANQFDHMLVAGTAIKYLDTPPPRPREDRPDATEASPDAMPGSISL